MKSAYLFSNGEILKKGNELGRRENNYPFVLARFLISADKKAPSHPVYGMMPLVYFDPQPPSTLMTCPVTKFASSDAK